eukprot:Amastigsp_a841269_24.p3 type:complete len:133 gc:universal Amastigsp_a841269_24:1045-647(-)
MAAIAPGGSAVGATPVFAASAIFMAMSPWIFCSIFSHTRGTPRKMVGRTSFIVSPSEPRSASGCANQTHVPRVMFPRMSIICPATCERGRNEMICSCSTAEFEMRRIVVLDVHTRLSPVTMTALGLPVVPDV